MGNSSEIVIASDHAGYELKEGLKQYLTTNNYTVVDLGTHGLESVDYPNYAHQAADYVINKNIRGILICGSGIGMSMAANKHPGVRAALCLTEEMAKLSREHNDSNMLVLGARLTDTNSAKNILDIWLKTKFEGGRHQRRVDAIDN